MAGYALYGGGFVTSCVCVCRGFLFCIFYIYGFFNVILILVYIILMYKIEEWKM